MGIVIFGAGYYGRLLRRIMEHEGERVDFFVDNNIPSGTYVEGIPVIRPCEIGEKSPKADVYISSHAIIDDVMAQLNKMALKNHVYMVPEYVYRYRWSDECPIAVRMDISKPRLPYLECKIVFHCNLNCNGCSAIANIHEKEFLSEEDFERDIKRLKELYSGIRYLKLFGGEPLLHPNLEGMIDIARNYFPDSELVVHSNGILVPEVNKKLLEKMHDSNGSFVFTLYPPTGVKKRQIENRLNMADVSYEFTPPVYEFRKYIDAKGKMDPIETFRKCAKCVNLYKGTVSCGLGHGIELLEKKFQTSIYDNKWEHCINIHETELNGWEINRILDSPCNLCKYCSYMDYGAVDEENYYPWHCGTAKLEDWLLDRV
ncbi:MAG: radical SAM protein [Lachnospiraceae bacterium]|nr:radical SAM protein [Lachnospiraceae bacterium]